MEQNSKSKEDSNKEAYSHYHTKCAKYSSKRRSHSHSGCVCVRTKLDYETLLLDTKRLFKEYRESLEGSCIHYCKSKKHPKKSRKHIRHSRSFSRSLSDSEYVCSNPKSRNKHKSWSKSRSRSKSRSVGSSTFSDDDDCLRRCRINSSKNSKSRSSSPPILDKMVSHDSQLSDEFLRLDGEGLTLPIVTDVGLHLTNFLQVLPFPEPTFKDLCHESLLSHLKNPEEARQHLNSRESTLIPSLIDALNFTSIELIEMKDYNYDVESNSRNISPLLKCLIEKNPVAFNDLIYGFSQKKENKGKEKSITDNPHELSNSGRQFSLNKSNSINTLTLEESCNDDSFSSISTEDISHAVSPQSSSSSSFTPNVSNSTNIIDGSPVTFSDVIKKSFLELSQSVPNIILEYSHSEIVTGANVNRLHNLIVQPSTVPAFQRNKNSKIVNQLENKQYKTDNAESAIPFSKLSPNDQMLAKKKQFSKKNKKSNFSIDNTSKPSVNHYQNPSKVRMSMNKLSLHRKGFNNNVSPSVSKQNKSNDLPPSFTRHVVNSSGQPVSTANVTKNVVELCEQHSPPENIAVANGIHNSVPDSCIQASIVSDGIHNSVPDSCIQASIVPDGINNSVPDLSVQTSILPDGINNSVPDSSVQTSIVPDGINNSVPDSSAQTSIVPDKINNSVPDSPAETSIVLDVINNSVPDSSVQTPIVTDGINNSVHDSAVQTSFVSASKPKRKIQIIDELERKQNNTHNRKMCDEECEDLSSKEDLPPATTSKGPKHRKMLSCLNRSFYNDREAAILLSKLSPEIKNFTLSSDRQFVLRNKKYPQSPSVELSDNRCRSSTLSKANSRLSRRSNSFKGDRSCLTTLSNNDCDLPLSSSSSSPQRTNSFNIGGPSVKTAYSVKNNQCPSIPNQALKKSRSERAKVNLNSIPDSTVKPSNALASKRIDGSEIINKLGNKKSEIELKPAVVLLSKLSPKDIELALKSVKQFTLRSKNIGSSAEHTGKKSNNRHRSFRKNSESSENCTPRIVLSPVISSLDTSNNLPVTSPSSFAYKPCSVRLSSMPDLEISKEISISSLSSSTPKKTHSSSGIIEPFISPIYPIEEPAIDLRQSDTCQNPENELSNLKSPTYREKPIVRITLQPIDPMQSNGIELIEISDSEDEMNVQSHGENSEVIELSDSEEEKNVQSCGENSDIDLVKFKSSPKPSSINKNTVAHRGRKRCRDSNSQCEDIKAEDESYRENSDLVELNGSKRSHNSLSEKTNDNTPANRGRKRRRIRSELNHIESSNSEDEKMDEMHRKLSPLEQVSQSLQQKKFRKMKSKKGSECESLLGEELMDSSTYQHFYQIVEAIFDSVEGIDFATEIDEDTDCPPETLLPLDQLQELSYEAAKLKRLHSMNQVPPGRLVHLLSILGKNIVDGTKVLPVKIIEEQEREEERLTLESTMERVMRSVHASLTALYIVTSKEIPQQVFLEDVIERIVIFLKYQLENTIYPVFDQFVKFDCKPNSYSIKQKRFRARLVKEKSIILLYNRLQEIISLLTELLDRQRLEDSIILQIATLGVGTFFVEKISELQLKTLRIVTILFSRYNEIRSVILEEILTSIVSLPSSKKCLKNYRLCSGEYIQIFTALVLQMMHSVARLPEPDIQSKMEFPANEEKQSSENIEKVKVDKDILIVTSYEESIKTAYCFLTVFINRCLTKHEETDYRPLFENFVHDLLKTLNKPEWPASELTLSILGKILLQKLGDKSTELNLRLASLEFLGFLAARLREDIVISQDSKNTINDVIQRIENDCGDAIQSTSKSKTLPLKLDNIQILQGALLQYLDLNIPNDFALEFSYRFYVAQWYKDAVNEVKYTDKSINFQKDASAKSRPVKKKKIPNNNTTDDDKINAEILISAEEKKKILLNLVKKPELCKVKVKKKEQIDYKTAELISQYLASTRHFAKRFDLYLMQILRSLGETTVAVRAKAMKCLTLVVEADPNILARLDVQRSVHGRLLDHSTSVREATVDLLGRFILIRPELISQYYDMLTERILDIGVSVRKRVIKILKNICLEQTDFSKIPEICVKILRRIDDEDSIRKLVIEVFQIMWFNPMSDKKKDIIVQKVKNITEVVKACSGTGLEWFEQLLTNILKNKEDRSYKPFLKSCKQIIDCLVENLLQLEEYSLNEAEDGESSSHFVACLETLYLFSKVHPSFIVPHEITILSYLTMKNNTTSSLRLLNIAMQIIELFVPLVEHPRDSLRVQLEEDIVKMIICQHMDLLPSCVRSLGVIVNKVTHNYKLVRDCFKKFFDVILLYKNEYEKDPGNEFLKSIKPKLLRSLYTVGLFCCHFDFDTLDFGFKQSGQVSLKETVFLSLLYFNYHTDEDIKLKALTALGFIMIQHYEFMLDPKVKTLYHNLLTSPNALFVLKCQVLKNIKKYLEEEEKRTMQKEAEWSKTSKNEQLKEMGDVTSGMASTIIQIYLKQVLECVLHGQLAVRISSLSVIQIIFGQGLVHPVEIVPYLICLGSDDTKVVRTNADELLKKISKKYPGIIQMRAVFGVRMSYKLQQIIQNPVETIRGFRDPDIPVSRNGALYSVIRSIRHNRRALLISLLKLFDEQSRTPLRELLYIADNIAYFPYVVQDEPLFIIHQLDIMLSLSLSISLQTFREALLPKQSPSAEGEENKTTNVEEDNFGNSNEDFDSILRRLPENISPLQECIVACQACALLLHVKETLQEMYDFADNKIQEYSPNATARVYERPLNRKEKVRFNPVTVLKFIESQEVEGELVNRGKEELVHYYLHFRQVLSSMDLQDDDDEEGTCNQAEPVTSILTVSSVSNSTSKPVGDETNIEVELPVANEANSETELPVDDETNIDVELPVANEANSEIELPVANENNSDTELSIGNETNLKNEISFQNETNNEAEPALALLDKTEVNTRRNNKSSLNNRSCKKITKNYEGDCEKETVE